MNPFQLYIDRLKNDDTEQIHEVVDPSFLQIQEKDLTFIDKVTVSGQAYLAKNHLILDLKIKAKDKAKIYIFNSPLIEIIAFEDATRFFKIESMKLLEKI